MLREVQEACRRSAEQRPAVGAAVNLGVEANAETLGEQILPGALRAQHVADRRLLRRGRHEEGTMSRTTELAPGVTPDAATLTAGAVLADADEDVQIDEELLIEEISIDGMCGVY